MSSVLPVRIHCNHVRFRNYQRDVFCFPNREFTWKIGAGVGVTLRNHRHRRSPLGLREPRASSSPSSPHLTPTNKITTAASTEVFIFDDCTLVSEKEVYLLCFRSVLCLFSAGLGFAAVEKIMQYHCLISYYRIRSEFAFQIQYYFSQKL